MYRKGFTLVELSIVLVIIGLLIGGILVAKSMIETVKVQSFVKQIQQFDVAVENFKTKYSSIPGDSRFISGQGNGDGAVNGGTFSGEIAYFWIDLQLSGFNYKNKTFSPTPPATGLDITSNNPNTPTIDMERKASIIASSKSALIPGSTQKINVFNIEGLTGLDTMDGASGGPVRHGPSAKPNFALAVDLKMDDGKPYSGILQNTEADGEAALAAGIVDCDDGVNSYTPEKDIISCEFTINMFSQTSRQYY